MSDEVNEGSSNIITEDINALENKKSLDENLDQDEQDLETKDKDDTREIRRTGNDKASDRDDIDSGDKYNSIEDSNENYEGKKEANDEDEGSDSDFGSFDDASFTEFEEPEEPEEINSSDYIKGTTSDTSFSEDVFNDSIKFEKHLNEVLDRVFPNVKRNHNEQAVEKLPLTERSSEILEELSKIPHLQPPNWIKLNVRHNLLIKLGVPINLDEIKEDNVSQASKVPRRKSVNEDDIKWDGFEIPKFENLEISTDKKAVLIEKTTEIISAIETDNLNNSSHKFLESSNSTSLQEKFQQFKNNYDQLIELSSVWNKQLDDQKKNSEVYESVVQNLIGYSQKLKREEILADLKKIKLKSKNKKGSFWK